MAKLPSLAKRFDTPVQNAQQSQLISELQSEIDKLRLTQSPELEQELEKLRTELKTRSGEAEILLTLIDPNPDQPRQTITSESVLSVARSLEKDGQIAPIILIPKGDRYLIWDGQRRYEASKQLGRVSLRAVMAPMPENLHRQSLLTFIHHEDLNTLDKAEAIVREIALASNLDQAEVPTLLSTVLRRLDRQKRSRTLTTLVTAPRSEQIDGLENLDLTPAEFQILSVLLDLTLNPASVKTNLVSVLALPTDLKQAIREDGLKAAHALALATLTGKTLLIEERLATRTRIDTTQTVITQDLSVRQTRDLIAEIKAQHLKTQSKAESTLPQITRNLEKISPDILEFASAIEITQLELLLQDKLAIIRAQRKGEEF